MPGPGHERTDLGYLLWRETLSIGSPYPEQPWDTDIGEEPHPFCEARLLSHLYLQGRNANRHVGVTGINQHHPNNLVRVLGREHARVESTS
jgi:hypothetical protein